MADPFWVFFGLITTIVGAALLRNGYTKTRQRLQLNKDLDAPSTLSTGSRGHLEGTVVAGEETLTAPFTGDEVVAHASYRGNNQTTGSGGAEGALVRGTPFYLRVNGNEVPVNAPEKDDESFPEGRERISTPNFAFGEDSNYLFDSNDELEDPDAVPGGSEMRLQEGVLRPGDTAYVAGDVVDVDGRKGIDKGRHFTAASMSRDEFRELRGWPRILAYDVSGALAFVGGLALFALGLGVV